MLLAMLSLLLLCQAGAAFARGGAQSLLPVVFVHGSSGSAAQFQSQAMRFTSNGYPQRLLYAFEYDTSVGFDENGEQVLASLDAFLDGVLAETGAEAVNTIGHSRGTTVMTSYLDGFPGGAEKVARYVNIDGRAPDALPGGVPTIGIWGEWNSGGDYAIGGRTAQIGPDPDANHYFPHKSHTEVATSAEAFALMYEFFTGRAPRTTDVVPEPPGRVSIAGRAVIFPQNSGYAGATVELWRVDPDTGYRIGHKPRYAETLDDSGAFGPLRVNGQKHYELALVRTDGSVHHFYQQPFARSDHFVRLNTSLPGTGIEGYIPRSEARSSLVVSRQREFWGDQGDEADELRIDGLDVLTDTISPRSDVILAAFAFDAGAPGTDLDAGVPFPFGFLSFLTAADVAIEAASPPDDVVSVSLRTRGGERVDVLNVPNWPSTTNRVTLQFRDYVQEAYGYRAYVRHRWHTFLSRLLARLRDHRQH